MSTRTGPTSFSSVMVTDGSGQTIGQSDFGYDGNGNTNSITHSPCATGSCDTDGSVVMSYDESGNLVSWTASGTEVPSSATSATFFYNYRHLRTRKAVAGATTDFWYTDAGQLLTEITEETGALRDYLWLGGRLIGVIDSSVDVNGMVDASAQPYWVHPGLLGEPLRMTDAIGNVVWSGDHDPFGNRAQASQDTVALNVGLPGQYWDGESALWYNWHRYYSAALGRYLEFGPVGRAPGAEQSYSYAAGQPLHYVDGRGWCLEDFCILARGCLRSRSLPSRESFSAV